MIVFISGMPRSGSTYAFNVVRELLSEWETVHYESSTELKPFLSRAAGKTHAIIKAHAGDSDLLNGVIDGTVKSICTTRDLLEAMASFIQTFDLTLEEAIRDMTTWLGMYDAIKAHSLILRYEEIERYWATEALRIARYLDPSFRWEDVAKVAQRFDRVAAKKISDRVAAGQLGTTDLGFSVVDNATFLHRGHVSAKSRPAEERIGRRAVARIREVFGSRMAEFGDHAP